MKAFWRDPAPAALGKPRATTLAHIGGATADDFTRTETRELFVAITEAIRGGATTKEAILARLPDHLREHAEWIDAAGGESLDAQPAETQKRLAAEMVTALRLLNVRRELSRIQQAMGDGPTDLALLRRVGDLTKFIREASALYPRAEGIARSAAGREGDKLPNRAPLDVLRFRQEAR